jgi:hypothetical protein
MKAFEVVVIDFGKQSVETATIDLEGEWGDAHPLNTRVTAKEIYEFLFKENDDETKT